MKANIKLEAIGYNSHSSTRMFGPLFEIPLRCHVEEIIGYDKKNNLKKIPVNGKVDYLRSNTRSSRGVYINFIINSGRVYEVAEPVSWKRTDVYFITVNENGEILRFDNYENAKKTIKPKCF